MSCWSGYQPGAKPLVTTGCCCTTGCSTTGRSVLGLDTARTTAMTTATIAMSTKIQTSEFTALEIMSPAPSSWRRFQCTPHTLTTCHRNLPPMPPNRARNPKCCQLPVHSTRSSSSASATSIDGSGPPRSRAARRIAATEDSSSPCSLARTALVLGSASKKC